MTVLAFIPARKGSKGVPGKNIRDLAGKPLITYSIEAARTCDLDIFISTDDNQVVSIAETLDVPVPYRRPPELAGDLAGMSEVLLDALDWLKQREPLPDAIVLLQPTSPFRTPQDIQKGIEWLQSSGADAVLGVSTPWVHPTECIRVDGDAWSYLIPPEQNVVRRQDYPSSFYFINGAFYGFRTQAFLAAGKIPIQGAKLLVMDEINSVDIDSERDFLVADHLMRARGAGSAI